MDTLHEDKLYINLKACYFLCGTMVFLGFVVLADGLKLDPEKVQTITEWPVPQSMGDVPWTCIFLWEVHKEFQFHHMSLSA